MPWLIRGWSVLLTLPPPQNRSDIWQLLISGVNDLSRPDPTTPRLHPQITLSLPHLPPLSHQFRGRENVKETRPKLLTHIITLQVYFRLRKYITQYIQTLLSNMIKSDVVFFRFIWLRTRLPSKSRVYRASLNKVFALSSQLVVSCFKTLVVENKREMTLQ